MIEKIREFIYEKLFEFFERRKSIRIVFLKETNDIEFSNRSKCFVFYNDLMDFVKQKNMSIL